MLRLPLPGIGRRAISITTESSSPCERQWGRRHTRSPRSTFRKKRNITGYERVGLVSDADAEEMRALALKIRGDVLDWLQRNQPELLIDKH